MPASLIITLIAETGREARAAEGIFDRERFRISEWLVPDFQDAGAKKMAPYRVRRR
jgi:hypothetical protein